ncbi:substrate-binding periplasmic protein [Roseibium sp.]|uniref:substrate-binding periplasmic protein n=1 Tax=Roseibium sp. TaxID=1936156 RepID=UPI000A5F17C6
MPILRILGHVLLGASLYAAFTAGARSQDKIIAYTGFLPPLSINAEERGIAVEIMELVAKEADIELDIRFAPWKRAQVLVENTPGSLIFSLAYTRKRSAKLKYIAPLIYTESAFITLDEQIDSFEQALADNKVIGVHLGSQRARILRRNGLTNLTEIATAEQMARMLQAGRVDAWYTISMRASYITRKQGFDHTRLQVGAPLSHGVQWLAANKSVSPALKARLSKAVSKVWRDPRYWQIVDSYLQ